MDVRRRGLAHDTAQDRAWVELPDVQHPPKLPPFEPKISSKSFVGTLTGDYHFVALLLHFTREREQRGTRSVEHRTLSGLDKPRIVRGNHARACVEDGLLAANRTRRRCCAVGLVELRLRGTDCETRNRSSS